MKKLKKNHLILGLILVLQLLSPMAFGDCLQNNFIDPLEEITQATSDLVEVVEANKKREDLMQANITYSFADIGVGKADIFLTTKDGKIVDLNVYAKVGVLGINQEIKQKVTIDQLMDGEPLSFEMEGGDRGVLVVQPEADLDENGGWATLKIWDGDRYLTEKIAIVKENGKFKIYKDTVKPKNQVTGLKVNMGGMSIPSMYVRKYKIKTRG